MCQDVLEDPSDATLLGSPIDGTSSIDAAATVQNHPPQVSWYQIETSPYSCCFMSTKKCLQ